MATVNLGAIKFNWKGTYNASTAYTIDDVVEYNGSSYVCKLASTGNLPTNTTYFDQMSAKGTDGTNGTDGTDLGTTLTTQGDIVYRNASGLARLGAGTSGQALITNGTGANPSWSDVGGGIENITTFLLTTALTMNSGTHHISTNWSTHGASLGSSVTESSGIFSFPQTGFYMVITNFALYRIQLDSAYVGIRLDTTNNNSTYTNKTITYTSLDSNTDVHSNLHQEYIFDVTDIANDKLKVNYECETASSIRLIGNSTIEQTSLKFIRLGDT